jgi:hypothetical protein
LPGPSDRESISVGDVMVHAFRTACENDVLRRLVLSMAFGLSPDAMAEDEAQMLHDILDGDR